MRVSEVRPDVRPVLDRIAAPGTKRALATLKPTQARPHAPVVRAILTFLVVARAPPLAQ